MKYNWAVWVNNRIVGYVRSESALDALKIAKKNIIKDNKNFLVERVYLGNLVPLEQEYFSNEILATPTTL